MRKSLALKVEFITSQEIEAFEVTWQSYYAFKKRYEDLEVQLKQMESTLIAKIEAGVAIDPSFDLKIKISERRYPHYKAALAEVAGVDHVQKVIDATPPTIQKSLIVKKAA
ncbi:MAG: hypothetical protein K1X29_08180 [Bdellovibrionales bacterium]|nr:hypothetical protein [Bdellovibrionales bacterium]